MVSLKPIAKVLTGIVAVLLSPSVLFGEDLGFPSIEKSLPDLAKTEVVLALHDEVEFKSEPLLLSQVAECSGDETLCQDIQGIDLEQKAAPGKAISLPVESIKRILAIEWPKVSVKMVGKPFVKLRCPAIVISNDEITEIVSKLLEERAKPESMLRVAIERLQMTAPLQVLEEEHSVSFPVFQDYADRPLPELLHALASSSTLGGMYRSNRGVIRFFAQISLKIEEKVSVARNYIPTGSAINESHFALQWYPWPTFRSQAQFVADLKPFLGFTLKRGIPAGEPLIIDAVSRPIAVQRGQTVQVFSKSESMSVSLKGTAQGSGTVGQAIEIELNSTKKKVFARIIDTGTAEIVR